MSNAYQWGSVNPGSEGVQSGTSVSGGFRDEYLFDIYNAGMPQHVQWLCKRFGKQFNPFANWFGALTRESALPSNVGHGGTTTLTPDTGHWFGWEENRYYETCNVKASQSISTNNAGIATDVQFDASVTGSFYGKQYDILMTPSGTTYQITDVTYVLGNAYVTFELTPQSATVVVATEFNLLKGHGVMVLTHAEAAGMGGTTGYTVGWTQRQFFLQILKGQTEWEGPQLSSKLWFEPAFDLNGNQKGLVSYDQAISQSRMERYLSGAYLFGQLNTNGISQTSARSGKTNYVYSTQGLIPTIQTQGNIYDLGGTTTLLDDLYNIKDYMIREGATSNTALLAVGSKLSKIIDDSVKTYIQGNGTDFTREVMDFFDINPSGNDTSKKDMAIAMGFRNLFMYDFNWVKNVIQELSDPTSFGAPNYAFDTAGLVIPMGYIKQKDSEGAEMNIAERYVEANGYNRKNEIKVIAGAGNWSPKVIADDLTEIHTLSHRGLQVLGANQMTYLAPNANIS